MKRMRGACGSRVGGGTVMFRDCSGGFQERRQESGPSKCVGKYVMSKRCLIQVLCQATAPSLHLRIESLILSSSTGQSFSTILGSDENPVFRLIKKLRLP